MLENPAFINELKHKKIKRNKMPKEENKSDPKNPNIKAHWKGHLYVNNKDLFQDPQFQKLVKETEENLKENKKNENNND